MPLFYSVGLPLGFRLTIAARTRPLGMGLTLWTRREQDEVRLVKANQTETMRRAR